MEERWLMSLLLDFYGELLTDRQRDCLALHYESDLSLGEIAEQMQVSRQAVHDNIHRAEQLLRTYEEKLQLVKQYRCRQQLIRDIQQALSNMPGNTVKIQELVAQLEG